MNCKIMGTKIFVFAKNHQNHLDSHMIFGPPPHLLTYSVDLYGVCDNCVLIVPIDFHVETSEKSLKM